MTKDIKNTDAAAALARLILEDRHDYKVLKRIAPALQQAAPDGRRLLKGVIVDTETTGLLQDSDAIIELGMVRFEYDPLTGQVYNVPETFDQLEQPPFPIPPESTEVHGITNEMVAGKKIDDAAVDHFLDGVAIAIAHNAAFDRVFLEKRLPVFEKLPWACSLSQIDWRGEGIGSAKLEYIAFKFGFFFDAHRADADCLALLSILQQPLPESGTLALKALLAQARQASYRAYANGAPFETKDALKARAYRWDGDKRCWHKTVTGPLSLKEETEWLKTEVYGGRSAKLEIEEFDSKTRFSSRSGNRTMQEI